MARPLTAHARRTSSARAGTAALWWLLAALVVVLPPVWLARRYADDETAAVATLFGVGIAMLIAAAALAAFFVSGRRSVAVPTGAVLALAGALAGAALAGGVGLILGCVAAVVVTAAFVKRLARRR